PQLPQRIAHILHQCRHHGSLLIGSKQPTATRTIFSREDYGRAGQLRTRRVLERRFMLKSSSRLLSNLSIGQSFVCLLFMIGEGLDDCPLLIPSVQNRTPSNRWFGSRVVGWR